MKKQCFGIAIIADLLQNEVKNPERVARAVVNTAQREDVYKRTARAALSIDVILLWNAGVSIRQICTETGSSRSTVARIISEYRDVVRKVHGKPSRDTPDV